MAPQLLPGRLGDDSLTPATDPRTHPKLLEVLNGLGAGGIAPNPEGVTTESSEQVLFDYLLKSEADVEQLYESIPLDLPSDATAPPVTRSVEVITGPDGNEIELYIYRPKSRSTESLPALIYLHGGGMTILKTENRVHVSWMRSLAAAGLVVVGVNFRNAFTPNGWNEFPAGLNDSAAGVRWVYANREKLGISKVVLQGESGGGNLVLATALKANREGWIDEIAGVYALVPFISGLAGRPDEELRSELPSFIENSGYLLSRQQMALNFHTYNRDRTHARNPLAFPYFAEEKDLKGLPPHVIAVDELDMLRDEGIAYYHKLAKAGVSVIGKINLGVTHAGIFIFRQGLSDHYKAIIAEIKDFAYRV